ncbi:NAD(P)/FAD-dependent oxidoreductase [Arthrobacter crystallopoietes]|uniref:NAD(P)/FAD-dependent oxidoreductase n=1 Tax=Crystallibacter crystallopoietes TaxID=37928 RepID=UPI001ABE16FC|nr:FAD-dependent oxidoreductase [Arthrobacter crystallopoietes]QTG81718.1 FAD-dependent oxidoreductase [Arthrobacter crystallopoietes]
MTTTTAPTDRVQRSLAHTKYSSVWFEGIQREPANKLIGRHSCDLLIVGAGFGGLWAAMRARKRHPDWAITVVDSHEVGQAASGRNGGFVSYSVTHGLANALARWPKEADVLERIGLENLRGFKAELDEAGIDGGLSTAGKLQVALKPHELAELKATVEPARSFGRPLELLSAEQTRARINSPSFIGSVYDPTGTMLIEPYRLVCGMKEYLEAQGVAFFENSPAGSLSDANGRMEVSTPYGHITSNRVILTTSAFPSLLRRNRLATVPVYDYALATEPLTEKQFASIGWAGREGLTDAANQFHYSRITADERILWGGYDAVYHYGSRISPELERRPGTFRLLAEQFFQTFPQLEVDFSHAWGGVIDTSTRFSAAYGTAYGNKVAYAIGHTGLGVGASRFAADTMLDLLASERTERTSLSMVRRPTIPFPPEPVRAAGINLTRYELARADRNAGKRGLWLKTLDALGLGFDS